VLILRENKSLCFHAVLNLSDSAGFRSDSISGLPAFPVSRESESASDDTTGAAGDAEFRFEWEK
jgi:hypothetical protein